MLNAETIILRAKFDTAATKLIRAADEIMRVIVVDCSVGDILLAWFQTLADAL